MRARGPLAALVAAAVLTACGAPSEGQVREIGPTEVPYGLLEPAPEPSADSSATAGTSSGPRVYFLAGDRLLAVPLGSAGPQGTGDPARLGDLLERLSAGPGQQERADGLSSALGPDVRLSTGPVVDGTARVSVEGLAENIAADRLPLAVGQVVLTATTAPGVQDVQLLRDGEVLEVPLPGGERTADPVSAGDYAALVGPEPATPVR
ncbi:GerMN domain-containing protein [Paenibacillus sp. TRM 82003]|uniref:GerMN domain-containing protein n=1 Tax=Kineococcus sp. TRM81007 TaxID=2925831 RepID=UPI001F55E689|nr:GerMN domain-containing protein [Kineococcus sp. TRM81007]MCI2237581.1 GerMN domain-containing protein [Kineococcus sp. TRM81007]MCI3921847.1 GerMN domain-containing protein [Paenibacillus sp. TRM 82003]